MQHTYNIQSNIGLITGTIDCKFCDLGQIAILDTREYSKVILNFQVIRNN